MEMRRRLEQQKQDQQMRAMQYSYPQVFAPVAAAYGPPPDGSPLHHPHLGPSAPATYSMNQPAMPGSMNAPSGMIQMSAAVNQSGIEYGIAPGYQMQPQSGVYIGPPVGYPHGAPMQANVYGMGSTGTDGQPYSNQGLHTFLFYCSLNFSLADLVFLYYHNNYNGVGSRAYAILYVGSYRLL